MIHNNHPELYSGLGKIADQIEVEHCLHRGLDTFTVKSEAALNSHAVHYLRGKYPERTKVFLYYINKNTANVHAYFRDYFN